MFNTKKMIALGVAAVMTVGICFAFSGCSAKVEKPSKQENILKSDSEKVVDSALKNGGDEIAAEPKAENAPADSATGSQSTTAPEETKYGDAEVYQNENGNPAAKTESGVEVELTQENMEKLFNEYQAVQGSNSDEERALLDQIQVLLEVSQNQNISE